MLKNTAIRVCNRHKRIITSENKTQIKSEPPRMGITSLRLQPPNDPRQYCPRRCHAP